jgi:AraC-like DNA-binding protein
VKEGPHAMNLNHRYKPIDVTHNDHPVSGMAFHSHPFYEIYYFRGGKCKYLIGDKIFVLSPGDLILMDGMTLHCPNVEKGEPYRRTIVHFDPALVKSMTDAPLAVNVLQPFAELKNHRIHLEGERRAEAERLLEKMGELYRRSDDKLAYSRLLIAFLELLLLIYEWCRTQEGAAAPAFPSDKERHAQNIIDYLERHYQEDLHLEQLEERLHLNKYYLSKLFKEVTGATIFHYLYNRRINQAKIHFLMDRELSVTEVSYKVGFKHPSHFTRMFKSMVGCTPDQYRRQHAPLRHQ